LPNSSSAAPLGDTNVTGYAYNNGDVYVTGNLSLNGGVLYIQGDLTVTGEVTGKGAIFTTGNATINGSANLTSDDSMALVSGGNITLTGLPSNMGTPSFQGLLYTQGNLTASNIALVGNYVANGGNTSVGNITLSNVSFLAAQDQTTIHITPSATVPASSSPVPAATSTATVANIITFLVNNSTGALSGSSGTATLNVTGHMNPSGSPTAYDLQLVPPAAPSGYTVVTAGFHPISTNAGPLVTGLTNVSAANLQNTLAIDMYEDLSDLPFTTANNDAATAVTNLNTSLVAHETTTTSSPSASPSALPSNAPAMDFSFNEFLTPVEEARVLMWQSADQMGTIEASSTTIP
jgi:hypothetical protein